MLIASQNECDLVLMAGDLFHENKPSRQTMWRAADTLKHYCFQPSTNQSTSTSPSAPHINFTVESNDKQMEKQAIQYCTQDPTLKLPVFAIHGNHDEPSGTPPCSSLDIFHSCGLLNYFGKQSRPDFIVVDPLILSKGSTRVAIYGFGSIRDERLYRTFMQGNVKFQKDPHPNTIHVIVFHQNRYFRGNARNFVELSFIPEWASLVLWGHEHQCILETENPTGMFHILQPGSSVATSLSQSESAPKHAMIVEFRGGDFRLVPIRLNSVRPFVTQDILLSSLPGLKAGTSTEDDVISAMQVIVKNLISQAHADMDQRESPGYLYLSDARLRTMKQLALQSATEHKKNMIATQKRSKKDAVVNAKSLAKSVKKETTSSRAKSLAKSRAKASGSATSKSPRRKKSRNQAESDEDYNDDDNDNGSADDNDSDFVASDDEDGNDPGTRTMIPSFSHSKQAIQAHLSLEELLRLPLIRLRVNYDGFVRCSNFRFGRQFHGLVANPDDILLFKNPKVTEKDQFRNAMSADHQVNNPFSFQKAFQLRQRMKRNCGHGQIKQESTDNEAVDGGEEEEEADDSLWIIDLVSHELSVAEAAGEGLAMLSIPQMSSVLHSFVEKEELQAIKNHCQTRRDQLAERVLSQLNSSNSLNSLGQQANVASSNSNSTTAQRKIADIQESEIEAVIKSLTKFDSDVAIRELQAITSSVSDINIKMEVPDAKEANEKHTLHVSTKSESGMEAQLRHPKDSSQPKTATIADSRTKRTSQVSIRMKNEPIDRTATTNTNTTTIANPTTDFVKLEQTSDSLSKSKPSSQSQWIEITDSPISSPANSVSEMKIETSQSSPIDLSSPMMGTFSHSAAKLEPGLTSQPLSQSQPCSFSSHSPWQRARETTSPERLKHTQTQKQKQKQKQKQADMTMASTSNSITSTELLDHINIPSRSNTSCHGHTHDDQEYLTETEILLQEQPNLVRPLQSRTRLYDLKGCGHDPLQPYETFQPHELGSIKQEIQDPSKRQAPSMSISTNRERHGTGRIAMTASTPTSISTSITLSSASTTPTSTSTSTSTSTHSPVLSSTSIILPQLDRKTTVSGKNILLKSTTISSSGFANRQIRTISSSNSSFISNPISITGSNKRIRPNEVEKSLSSLVQSPTETTSMTTSTTIQQNLQGLLSTQTSKRKDVSMKRKSDSKPDDRDHDHDHDHDHDVIILD